VTYDLLVFFVPAERRNARELRIETTRVDLHDPVVRDLLADEVLRSVEETDADHVMFATEEEGVNHDATLAVTRLGRHTREGRMELLGEFFERLDEMAPPPRSGVRRRWHSVQENRRRARY